jgi:DNA polymerase III subunit epsilon
LYNRAQRRALNAYGLYDHVDENGYLCLYIRKNTSKGVPVVSFNNMTEAREFHTRLTAQYELCQRLNGLYPGNGACFHYTIRQCRGACAGLESPESYNARSEEALKSLEFTSPNLVIIDHGRDQSEQSVVLIESGKYMGYGFLHIEEAIHHPSVLHDILFPAADNREIRRIINDFLRRNKVRKILRF